MRILMSCGEPSGDLYAGALVERAARARARHRDLSASAAIASRRPAAELLAHYRGLSVTGLDRSRCASCPRALALHPHASPRRPADVRPDVFVADRFSRRQLPPDGGDEAARHSGGLLHRPAALGVARVADARHAAATSRRCIVIFPFEEALYRDAGVPVEFVGHPLVEMAEAAVAGRDARRRCGTSSGSTPARRRWRCCRAAGATSWSASCR